QRRWMPSLWTACAVRPPAGFARIHDAPLLVVLRFRSSYLNALQMLTSFRNRTTGGLRPMRSNLGRSGQWPTGRTAWRALHWKTACEPMILEQFTIHAPYGGIVDHRSPPEAKIALFHAPFVGAKTSIRAASRA